MDMVTVTHDELAELLGVPASTPPAKLKRLMEKKFAEIEAAKKARVERRKAREDGRLVDAAIADGRLTEGSRDRWVHALAEDRANNRALLASFTPVLAAITPTGRSRPDAASQRVQELEDLHDQVLASFGITRGSAGRIAASAADPQAKWERIRDVEGTGLPGFRRQVGKPPEQWTDRERSDAMMREFSNPMFHVDAQPAPGREFTYLDSPTALYKIDPATGRFVERTHQERQALGIRGYQR